MEMVAMVEATMEMVAMVEAEVMEAADKGKEVDEV